MRFMLWKVEEGVNTNNSNNTNGADVNLLRAWRFITVVLSLLIPFSISWRL